MTRSSVPVPRPSRLRSRSGRIIAGTLAATVVAGGLTLAGGSSAGAATKPNSQAVGNFLDANLGNKPLDDIAKLKYASAVSPGTTSVQNPLDVTALNTINLPLTGDVQLPELAGIKLGAVNQVAVAKSDGYSYGAAGAVANSGGASVGGNNAAYPADATIDLDASSLAGNTGLPIPGGTGTADALGGVHLKIGAVSALAATPAGAGKKATTQYSIADLSLQVGSPLLGGVLSTVTGALGGVLTTLTKSITSVSGGVVPTDCSLLSGQLPTLSLEGGAITIDPATATITVSLEKLLAQLGVNLNKLPANTDLIDYLLNYLTSPTGLAKGLQGAIDGLLNPLEDELNKCLGAVQAVPVLGPIVAGLVTTLEGGQKTLETTVSGLVGSLAGAVGVNPLAPIGTLLKNLIDIGINVQPNGAAGSFKSALQATPKQGTPVVAGQTIVRAIEIDLVGDPLATVALANAAAGPSAPAAVTPVPPATTPAAPPATAIPTGVPAGQAVVGGSPTVPLVLLIVGLLMAGGGAVAWKVRGRNVL